MTGRHATGSELQAYVLGMLEPSRVRDVEAHCAACDACAATLAGEASLEIAFEQVAKRAARVQGGKPLRAVAYGAAGMVAMAAGVLLWFARAPVMATGEGAASTRHAPMEDGAILDARNDALDGG